MICLFPVSIVAGIMAVLLVISETSRCISLHLVEEMSVDASREETMHIRFNITFPALPCRAIRVTMGDSSGNFETESILKQVHDGEIHKWRLDEHGRRMERQEFENVRGSDNPYQILLDYKDLKSIRDEIIGHQGCNIYGWMDVKRVSGNIALMVRQEAILAAEDDVGTMEALIARYMRHMGGLPVERKAPLLLNASHIINMFHFGTSYKGQIRPLEDGNRVDRQATGLDKYFIKVVPVTIVSYWGRQMHSHDYSVTEYYESIPDGSPTLPGTLFMYDLWPIRVTKTTSRLGLLHLLVRLCAIIGGLWTVTGLANRIIHLCLKRLRRIKVMQL